MDHHQTEKLRDALKQFNRSILHDHECSPPNYLYHFTSTKGLQAILRSKRLWVSDIRRTGGGLPTKPVDMSEGQYWLKVVKGIVNRKSVHRCLQEFLIRNSMLGLGTEWCAYIACFSGQINLPSQWEKYADDHFGVAIELNYPELFSSAERGAFSICRMLYDRKAQERVVEQICNNAIKLRKDWSISYDDRPYWFEIAMQLLQCQARFKSVDWEAEQEWRLEIDTCDRSNAKFRTAPDGEQTAYLEIDLGPPVVSTVVRGARCTLSDAEITSLTESCGYPLARGPWTWRDGNSDR